MRILVFGDTHWSATSSIVRSRGSKYTTRLENLINSLNWIQQVSIEKNCDEIVCLGDFFDRCNLDAEEISALKEIKWNENILAHFIVGNHEYARIYIVFNSTDALYSRANIQIEDKPYKQSIDDKTDIYFIPYMIEDERKDLKEYLTDFDPNKKHIVFSHNDIKGIQYGMFESKEGFSLNEIEQYTDLYINGHLHNGSFLNEKKTILNLGNLTGQNFGEDAFKYEHHIAILDTDTLEMEFIENPFAFNFYKVEINQESDLTKLDSLKQNAVISIKCVENYVDKLKEKLNNLPNIVESKVILYRAITTEQTDVKVELGNNDYLNQFSEFIVEKLGSSDVVKYELAEVCK